VDHSYEYERALERAEQYMDAGVEPTSALKQAASDFGIPYGHEMAEFVEWARREMGGRP
jgi:hypothetical protein